MISIKDLIERYGSQRALALAMGVHQPQVNRWLKAGALVSEQTGDVYIKTRTTKPLHVVECSEVEARPSYKLDELLAEIQGEPPRVDGWDSMPAVGKELI